MYLFRKCTNAMMPVAVVLVTCSSLHVMAVSPPVRELSANIGQKGAPFEFVPVPGEPDTYYHVQRTRPGDDRLFLTANNVYFRPTNWPLICDGQGPVALQDEKPNNININQGRSFAYIRNWDVGDKADWGIWLESTGSLAMAVHTGGAAGARFAVRVADQETEFVSKAGAIDQVSLAEQLTFKIDKPGFYVVTIECLAVAPQSEVRLHWLELRGPSTKHGGVVRVRWRPAASHAQFTSSRNDRPVRLWVIEMDAKPATHNFFAPITTPFGYYGPTWTAEGKVGETLNFSLWSFRQGAPEPPIEELSQIVAVGNPQAEFDGFTHEGTGAKIRNWRPFEGRQQQNQVFALRFEPGQPTEDYDTFYSYFYAADEGRWRLFGIGQKHNANRRRPPEQASLRIGSFVEVPGPAARQRTGPYPRTMRYRGWIMDDQDSWYALDRMTYGNVDRQTGLTHTRRGLDDNGWFFNTTGGWVWRTAPDEDYVHHPNPTAMSQVEYMRPVDRRFLMSVPSKIEVEQLTRTSDGIVIRYTVRGAGDNASVTAFWGSTDGRAFRDRWDNEAVITRAAREGLNQAVVPSTNAHDPFFVTLLLENSQGRFFTYTSSTWNP